MQGVSGISRRRPNSAKFACPRIRRLLPLLMRGWNPFWRANLAYGHTFLARQDDEEVEPKKSCIGNKDLAPF